MNKIIRIDHYPHPGFEHYIKDGYVLHLLGRKAVSLRVWAGEFIGGLRINSTIDTWQIHIWKFSLYVWVRGPEFRLMYDGPTHRYYRVYWQDRRVGTYTLWTDGLTLWKPELRRGISYYSISWFNFSLSVYRGQHE